ncbi:MAG: thioredoxin [Flavobacterium sp.]|nr:MAG: thioredoxin [Flavobacterium sp.]
MFLELTEDNLQQHLTENTKVMVQYAASWCGNCRIMKPKFKKMAAENEDVAFLIVDAEKYPNSRKFANVDNLPTFAAFENGALVDQVQTNKAEGLAELFTKINNN